MSQAEAFINTATWDRLLKNLGDDLVDVVEIFLEDTPGKLVEIGSAYQQGDSETARRNAHSIKSSSAIFGANKLSVLCFDLEKAIERGEGGILDRLAEIQQVYAGTADQLTQKLAQSGYTHHKD